MPDYFPLSLARCLLAGPALLLTTLAAVAADGDGRFMVKGGGRATCAEFLAARREPSGREYASLAGWVDGYLTYMNQREPETFDMTPWQGTELVLSAISVQCKNKPGASFHEATFAVTQGLRDGRLRSRSEIVSATVGGNSIVLYADVVTKIQQRLKLRGLLDSDPNGKYDEPTIAAVKAFQAEKQLPSTGLPDQLTLASLL